MNETLLSKVICDKLMPLMKATYTEKKIKSLADEIVNEYEKKRKDVVFLIKRLVEDCIYLTLYEVYEGLKRLGVCVSVLSLDEHLKAMVESGDLVKVKKLPCQAVVYCFPKDVDAVNYIC